MGTYIAKDATGTRALDVTGNARRREITTTCECDCQGTLLVDYDTAQKLLAEAAENGAAVITWADFRKPNMRRNGRLGYTVLERGRK